MGPTQFGSAHAAEDQGCYVITALKVCQVCFNQVCCSGKLLEATAPLKSKFVTSVPRGRVPLCMKKPHGEAPGWSGGSRNEETWQEPLLLKWRVVVV